MTRPYLLLLAAAAAVLLASCGTSPIEVPKEVKVEVPVACLRPEDRPAPPRLYTYDELMAMDRYRRTLAAWGDLLKVRAYAAELEAIAEACSRIPAPS